MATFSEELPKWLKVAAHILGYIAAALTGGIIAGCKNGALVNLC